MALGRIMRRFMRRFMQGFRNGLELPTPTLPIRIAARLERRRRTDASIPLRLVIAGVGIVSSGIFHVCPAPSLSLLLRLLPLIIGPIVFRVVTAAAVAHVCDPQTPH